MKRLTHRSENGTAVYRHPTSEPDGWKANRHAVLELCCKYEETGLTPEEITDGKLLTGWIPVEERLPKMHTDVLVAVYDFGNDTSTFIDCLEDNNGKNTWSTYNGATERVLAWMPLPEPYSPVNEDLEEKEK